VNDVILALVTATIRRYLELHGDPVKGRELRMMVPVNLRGTDGPGELGNRISLVPVTIPLDIRSPRKLLASVHKRTELLKRAHTAEIVSLAGGLIGMFPNSAQALAGHIISRLPFTPFNMVCTNVPGPQQPLYLLGHKMLCLYPYVPVGGEMALNCAILTYDGTAYFGFSGCAYAAPDLRRLETFLKLSFTELRESAGVRPPQEKKKRVHANPKVASKPGPAPVRVPVALRPLVAVDSTKVAVPPVEEENVLTRLIA
jgi:diacylglycerol O-acyltransferase